MNIGDTLICIKDFNSSIADKTWTFTKGKQYKIDNIPKSLKGDSHSVHVGADVTHNYGNIIYFSTIKGYNQNNFYDYFITLKDWRDKQLNKLI